MVAIPSGTAKGKSPSAWFRLPRFVLASEPTLESNSGILTSSDRSYSTVICVPGDRLLVSSPSHDYKISLPRFWRCCVACFQTGLSRLADARYVESHRARKKPARAYILASASCAAIKKDTAIPAAKASCIIESCVLLPHLDGGR